MLDFSSDLLSFLVPDKAMRMEKDSLNIHPNYLCAVLKKDIQVSIITAFVIL